MGSEQWKHSHGHLWKLSEGWQGREAFVSVGEEAVTAGPCEGGWEKLLCLGPPALLLLVLCNRNPRKGRALLKPLEFAHILCVCVVVFFLKQMPTKY